MKGFLTDAQIRYVLFHLKQHFELTPEHERFFLFQREAGASQPEKVNFVLSDRTFSLKDVATIEDLPVLFPCGEAKTFFAFENNRVIFNHDLLKSIFYLLSGYQEYENPTSKDQLNRFAFEDSVQHKLGFVAKPLVNYYFEVICHGLETFFASRNITCRRRRLFKNYGFFLSHDIDYVDLYTKNYVIYKLKEIAGMRPSKLSTGRNIGLLVKGLKELIVKKSNPYWNFNFLRDVERRHSFKSVFYFLDQGVLHSDAYYSFSEKRVTDLFEYLKSEGCEIGLHGPVRSRESIDHMQQSLRKLEKFSNTKALGARQHRLLWTHPLTAKIQQEVGLRYDTTLGFAAHEGFRNSYCYPFRLFDFEQDKMMHIWEFPMNAMDVTLFSYRQYNSQQAFEKCSALIEEAKRFGGIFNFLWHNSFFDEDTYPGVTRFYTDMLAHVQATHAENVLGTDLLNKLQNTQ